MTNEPSRILFSEEPALADLGVPSVRAMARIVWTYGIPADWSRR